MREIEFRAKRIDNKEWVKKAFLRNEIAEDMLDDLDKGKDNIIKQLKQQLEEKEKEIEHLKQVVVNWQKKIKVYQRKKQKRFRLHRIK